jgi:hypothetical protein
VVRAWSRCLPEEPRQIPPGEGRQAGFAGGDGGGQLGVGEQALGWGESRMSVASSKIDTAVQGSRGVSCRRQSSRIVELIRTKPTDQQFLSRRPAPRFRSESGPTPTGACLRAQPCTLSKPNLQQTYMLLWKSRVPGRSPVLALPLENALLSTPATNKRRRYKPFSHFGLRPIKKWCAVPLDSPGDAAFRDIPAARLSRSNP